MTAPKEPSFPSPRPGDLLAGKYLLTRVLGEGGMGTVFAAHEETLGRDVAVKLLHARGLRPETVFRGMRREARALAAVDHPNIVRVIEAGATKEGAPFLVMELVHGKTLRLLSEHLGPIDVISTIAFGIQMARALSAAHQRGVVHGDFKPDNVLVTPEARVKVGDFGLARHIERGRFGTTDELVAGCGTPHYMAPELFSGSPSSAASDVYALGATLIELLTGKHMFAVDSVDLPSRIEVRRMHLEIEPEPIENVCGALVAPLGALVRLMVAKDPRERPTAAEVVEGLRYEHLRLRKHFPDNQEDSSDMEEEDPAPSRPRKAARARAPMPDAEPSARVHAFVTEPLSASFVPAAVLPFGRKNKGFRDDAAAVLRQKATDPMPAPAASKTARPNMTEPLVPASPGARREARGRERAIAEGEPREGRVVPSGEAVTLPLAKRAPARATNANAAKARSRVRPATVAAIGFACLSAALLGRDLLLKLRQDDARTEVAAPTAPLSASASSVATTADPGAVGAPGSSAPAASNAPSSEPSAADAPSSVPTQSARPSGQAAPSGVRAPGAPRVPPARTAPSVTAPGVVDPWAKPSKPGRSPVSPTSRSTSGPVLAPTTTSGRPSNNLPFGKEGN